MTPLESHLTALDVLEAALTAETVDELVEATKPDLEVLSREDLIRVAMAIALEARRATAPADLARMLRQVEQRRLVVMMDGS